MTPEHLKLIKRYTERIFLLFDNDDAGQEANLRALTLAYQNDIFPKIVTLPDGFKDIDELANTAEGKTKFDTQRKESQDGFSVIFQNMKKKFDLTSPIDKQKILNIMFNLILNINSSAMQDHYIQILGEKLGIGYEIMRAQYVQYAKNEGRYTLQQKQRQKSTEPKYEIDREMLVTALFYENYIKQYQENENIRQQLFDLVKQIKTNLSEIKISKTEYNENEKETLIELQLRREKELADKEEDKKYQTIKQIILPILQTYIKQITKETTVSKENKQQILNFIKTL